MPTSSSRPTRLVASVVSSTAAFTLATALIGCAHNTPSSSGAGEPLTAQLGEQAIDTPLADRDGNPFIGAHLFVNPDFREAVLGAKAVAPQKARELELVANTSTAIWLDSIAKAERISRYLDEADQERKRSGKPVVVSFVAYDLPNRDCAAKSSAGELAVDRNGEALYRSAFIDPIARALAAYPYLKIAMILEPDSLANLATNLDQPKCVAAANAYKHGVAYAISKLHLPHVAIYLDAAHAGWLGWAGNRAKMGKIFKEVLDEAGGGDMIRGFATNVSNYNVLHGDDGATLEPTNPCPDELTYVKELADSLRWAGIKGRGFIVDTSRNGQAGTRHRWGAWCNIAKAGLGERPRAEPAPLVDAFLWVKVPGESDGTSDKSQPRFDAECASPDSATAAPQAGQFFTAHFLDMLAKANPPL